MSYLELSHVIWRKSSRSGAGQNCVEVGVWRKSSLSNANGGQCVEVGVWNKSTLSGGNGGSCVEVAAVDTTQNQAGADADRLFLVRDSKDPDGPVLSFTPSEWADFLNVIKDGSFDGLAVRHEV